MSGVELRVGKKFRLGRKFNSGSFGDLYLGVNVQTGEEVAIKLEPVRTQYPQLVREAKVYKAMEKEGKGTCRCGDISLSFCPLSLCFAMSLIFKTCRLPSCLSMTAACVIVFSVGIPRVRWCGGAQDYTALVMDMLGPSLEDRFEACGQRLGLKTVLSLADQLLLRLESLHAKGYIHR